MVLCCYCVVACHVSFWGSVLVAVKTIIDSPNRSKSQREMFLAEVAIMSRLRHPHIVQLLGVTMVSAVLWGPPRCVLTAALFQGWWYTQYRHGIHGWRWVDLLIECAFAFFFGLALFLIVF